MLTLHKLGPAKILGPISTTITEKTISVDISVYSNHSEVTY